ncbi:tripartite tricarboxylate transporter TctB family protein [Billgrantia sp. Q4P2]|uniref:tripartite tricarboxylate transporter TctB family protein n=1 Tax=Billgrantia sp. Q4P2 TaxID=3463857 RepID=UPI004057976A
MTSTDHRDLVGGMLMLTLGVFIIVYTQRYDIGTLANMGPGYFPLVLGVLLTIFGCLIAIPAFFRTGTPITVNWRSYLLVIGSLLFYALTLRTLGLLLSTGMTVLLSSMASPVLALKGRLVLVLCVVGVTYLVFMLGLNMRLPLWPSIF